MLSAAAIALGAAALDEAKSYLRVETAAEDALIERLMLAATALCEQFTGRLTIRRAASETLPASTAWTRLAAAPVAAITAVEALPRGGGAVALAATDYAVDVDAAGEGWVRLVAADDAPRIRVAYEAGLAAEWASLPELLRQGIVRLAAHLYAHRDGAGDAGPPAAVAALWRPWRRLRLG